MAGYVRKFPSIVAVVLSIVLPLILPQAKAEDSETRRAQAMQFGLFFGGIATQYDECTRRGFVPSGDRPAEDKAAAYLKASEQFGRDKEGSEYVQKGWNLAKQKIQEQSQEYWEKNCQSVAQQWNKYVDMFKLQ